MARDVSQALGAQQLAGAVVMPKGHAWQHLRVHTGLAGAVAGEAIAASARKHAQAHPSQTSDFPRSAFLAVTGREVALLRLGSGGIKNGRPSELLARVPRSQVAMARVPGWENLHEALAGAGCNVVARLDVPTCRRGA